MNEYALNHFTNLARRGSDSQIASSGEIRARKLADCILEHIGGLDEDAIAGLEEFIRAASVSYPFAKSLVEGRSRTTFPSKGD